MNPLLRSGQFNDHGGILTNEGQNQKSVKALHVGLVVAILAAVGISTTRADDLVVVAPNGETRTIYDSDGDGWDDLWCALFSDIKHRNKTTNTDGDSLTDYEEMVMWQNPVVEDPTPRVLTPEEIAAATRARAEALAQGWEQRMAEVTPRLRPLIPPGELIAAPRRQKAEQRLADLRQKAAELRAAQPAKEQSLDALAARLA